MCPAGCRRCGMFVGLRLIFAPSTGRASATRPRRRRRTAFRICRCFSIRTLHNRSSGIRLCRIAISAVGIATSATVYKRRGAHHAFTPAILANASAGTARTPIPNSPITGSSTRTEAYVANLRSVANNAGRNRNGTHRPIGVLRIVAITSVGQVLSPRIHDLTLAEKCYRTQ